MARRWAVAAGLTILLSGCAGTAEPVRQLSAACPFLASPEVNLYLDPDLIMLEQQSADDTLFGCDFKRGNDTVVAFTVGEIAARGQTPTALINSISRRARARTTTAMQGLGDAAVYYELQRRRFAVLTVAKQAGSNIRVISVTAQMPFSQTRLAALASIALARL
ncbi:hypothetical protein JOF56_004668 [Kibdelosporangium banguiense]|uniref:DUF3558 domain-containing protein n=1 Tax=Kibdelosporangium banguiense TaxID=1365924 RepID=A0ABS4TIN5_9PSEU|nr:hypothetical protein [Kibdelosporangium banguiense]MBP2324283.1 hypothetical protein [Kibdelosporangium banguiense]